MPAGLLAQDAGWLAVFVQLDHASGDLEVAVGMRERRRVEPERVRVARHQRDRAVGNDLVEQLLRRLGRRRPVAAAPAPPAQPAVALRPPEALADACERLVERARVLEPHLVLGDRPGREVHVRVAEAGENASAAQVDPVGTGQSRLVRADAAGDPAACDREAAHDRQRRLEGPDDAVLEDHSSGIVRSQPPAGVSSAR